MRQSPRRALLLAPALLTMVAGARTAAVPTTGPRFTVSFPASRSTAPQDGRVLLLVSTDSTAEPRFQIQDGPATQLVFGLDVAGVKPGQPVIVGPSAWGYPIRSLKDLPKGRYRIQALLNRYQTFHRSDGHTVSLPPDRGEGQSWSSKPGNFYSKPRWIDFDPKGVTPFAIAMDQEVPPPEPPRETKYVRYERIQSKLLSDFWGTPTYLGAFVLLPEGFDTHPDARYPLVINHGHFPGQYGGFRETPPDPNLKPDYSERFHLAGYNRIQEESAYQFYQDWTGPDFPRGLLIEIQHPTPFYDDSYAVNSANNGPYGDAIMKELVPYLEKK